MAFIVPQIHLPTFGLHEWKSFVRTLIKNGKLARFFSFLIKDLRLLHQLWKWIDILHFSILLHITALYYSQCWLCEPSHVLCLLISLYYTSDPFLLPRYDSICVCLSVTLFWESWNFCLEHFTWEHDGQDDHNERTCWPIRGCDDQSDGMMTN